MYKAAMLSFLPAPLLGIISFTLYILNLFFVAFLAILSAVFMYAIPIPAWQKKCSWVMHEVVPNLWVRISDGIIALTIKTQWEVRGSGDDKLHLQGWYLLISNHQSWLDIIVLEKVFQKKIPMLKFFMKRELLWTLPVAGVACWLMGFPFVSRYSKEYLKKHPEKVGKDWENTKRACEKFKDQPLTIINYIEGTRVTEKKHQRQASPYKYLLKPKAGGFAFVLEAMEGHVDYIIDTTIIYPDPKTNLWQFMCGKTKKIIVCYEVLPVTKDLLGNYYQDRNFRINIQHWLNQLWQKKDKLIETTIEKERFA